MGVDGAQLCARTTDAYWRQRATQEAMYGIHDDVGPHYLLLLYMSRHPDCQPAAPSLG